MMYTNVYTNVSSICQASAAIVAYMIIQNQQQRQVDIEEGEGLVKNIFIGLYGCTYIKIYIHVLYNF